MLGLPSIAVQEGRDRGTCITLMCARTRLLRRQQNEGHGSMLPRDTAMWPSTSGATPTVSLRSRDPRTSQELQQSGHHSRARLLQVMRRGGVAVGAKYCDQPDKRTKRTKKLQESSAGGFCRIERWDRTD